MRTLNETLLENPTKLNFFKAVSIILEMAEEQNLVEKNDYSPVRFLPGTSIAFPKSDIANLSFQDKTYFFELAFMSLTGVSSPLPVYFSEYAYVQTEKSKALLDFLTIFNHRIYTLFYRSWKKYFFLKAASPNTKDSFCKELNCLTGNVLCTPRYNNSLEFLFNAGVLSGLRKNRQGLESFIASFLPNFPVKIRQLFPRWVPIKDQKKIGNGISLGTNAILGTSIQNRSGSFRIMIGPLDRDAYNSLLSNKKIIETIQVATRQALNGPYQFDIEIVLQAQSLIPVVLGDGSSQLGKTSCLGFASHTEQESVVVG